MQFTPLPNRQISQCLFCPGRKCYTRIYTDDLAFDEVACYAHVQALEIHADKTLNGKLRRHLTSSETVRRVNKTKSRKARKAGRMYDAFLRLAEVSPDLTFHEFLVSPTFQAARENSHL